MLAPDIGHVYPKTGLDADLRFDTTPRFVSSGSMFLDGTDDFLNLDGLTWTSSGANYSFTCWVKSRTGSTDAKRVFGAKSSSASDRINLYWDSGVTLKSYTEDGTTNTFTIGAVGLDDTWHHFALTVGSGTAAKFYLDGQLIATDTQPDMDFSSCDDFVIGAAYDGNTSTSFDGNICHFGVWHDELSPAEIRSLMTATTYAEAVSKGGSTPRAYYLLEANANDSVGTQNGTLTNGAAIVGERARLPNGFDTTNNRMDARLFSGRAIDIDGAGDYISLAHPADLDGFFNTGGTISMWINMTSTATFERLCDFSGGTSMYLQGSFGGYIFNKDFSTTDGNWTYNGNGGVALGEWFHFCLSYNAASTSNDPALYINGVLQTIDGETAPVGSAGAETTEKLFGINADKSNNPLDASLADIKLFTSALSSSQALELYQNPEQALPTGIASSALKCWLSCSDYDIATADNSLNGLYAQDASGNGNHGALTNCGMIFSQSSIPQLGLRSSSSRILFQTAQEVTISSAAGINVFSGADGGGTVAFWMFVSSDGEDNSGRVLFKNSKIELITRNESSGTCELKLEVPGFSGGSANHHSPKTVNIGQWNHVVMTYTGLYNANPIFYINNATASNTTDTQTTGTFTDTGDLLLGDHVTAARSIDGILSEVAFWSSILDADAIAVLYNSGVQGFDPTSDSGNYDVAADLTAFYKLDNPVTIEDLSTNSNNGTVSGTPAMVTIPEGSTDGLSTMGTLTQNRLGSAVMPMSIVADEDAGSSPGILAYAKGPTTSFDNTDFTVTMWVHLSNTPSNMRYFHWVPGTGYILMKLTSAGKHECLIEGATANEDCTPNLDVRNAWSFVAFRKDADDLKAFAGLVTDASLTSEAKTTAVGNFVGSAQWYLGSDNAAYRGLSGSIAMPRIWTDTALSDAQINALFESGKRILRGD